MIGVNAETSTGMGAIGRMQVVVRYERVSHLYRCTPERQSLCESHRQRRWLTCWSYGESLKISSHKSTSHFCKLGEFTRHFVLVLSNGAFVTPICRNNNR